MWDRDAKVFLCCSWGLLSCNDHRTGNKALPSCYRAYSSERVYLWKSSHFFSLRRNRPPKTKESFGVAASDPNIGQPLLSPSLPQVRVRWWCDDYHWASRSQSHCETTQLTRVSTVEPPHLYLQFFPHIATTVVIRNQIPWNGKHTHPLSQSIISRHEAPNHRASLQHNLLTLARCSCCHLAPLLDDRDEGCRRPLDDSRLGPSMNSLLQRVILHTPPHIIWDCSLWGFYKTLCFQVGRCRPSVFRGFLCPFKISSSLIFSASLAEFIPHDLWVLVSFAVFHN